VRVDELEPRHDALDGHGLGHVVVRRDAVVGEAGRGESERREAAMRLVRLTALPPARRRCAIV
jgi:hypothetical protein